MKTRTGWGIVYMAVIFALIAVGTAFATYSFEQKAKTAQVLAVTNNFSNWQAVSDTVGTTSGEATPQTPLSQAISQDLLTGYNGLLSKGTFTKTELDQMLAGVVKKNVQAPAIVPSITLTDLTIGTTSVQDYLTLLTIILNQSLQVKRYEVAAFTEKVTGATTKNAVELESDAILYQRIAAAMLLMEVPQQLAPQHLEAVKSVGALARAVANMAGWKNDPIEALAYLDSFNKAESYVTVSLNNIIAAAAKLQKKT